MFFYNMNNIFELVLSYIIHMHDMMISTTYVHCITEAHILTRIIDIFTTDINMYGG